MIQTLKSQRGQYIPIAALVMFTAVVFMVAAVNVYKVAHMKLKLQNIADAVALNIAGREAASLNWVADRNEWLNHMYANSQSPDPQNPCAGVAGSKLIPGLSCVEYTGSGYVFSSQTGAKAYGRIVQSVNDSQMMAKQAFNSFIGAPGTGGNLKALEEILRKDIQEFENDSSLKIIVWNSSNEEQAATNQAKTWTSSPGGLKSAQTVTPLIQALDFKAHDLVVVYKMKNKLGMLSNSKPQTMSSLLGNGGGAIGWMTVDSQNMPTMSVNNGKQTLTRIGAGAIAMESVTVFGRSVPLSAKGVAYVVPGSGRLTNDRDASLTPTWKPTFWVKLVGPNG